jgi:large subunit ribosomal protein L21
MYAVVKIGGRQYRVAEGDVLYVDKQSEEAGDSITFDRVLLVNDGDGGFNFGGPVIEGATVEATLVDQVKADKVIVFKKKRRKGYKKKNGHRQPMSQIKIDSILTSDSDNKKKTAEDKETKKEEKASAAEKKTEKKEKTTTKDEAPKTDAQEQVSTDMTAKEAIDHIENTPLNELQGFVPDSEDRVTVERVWEDKQENEG